MALTLSSRRLLDNKAYNFQSIERLIWKLLKCFSVIHHSPDKICIIGISVSHLSWSGLPYLEMVARMCCNPDNDSWLILKNIQNKYYKVWRHLSRARALVWPVWGRVCWAGHCTPGSAPPPPPPRCWSSRSGGLKMLWKCPKVLVLAKCFT